MHERVGRRVVTAIREKNKTEAVELSVLSIVVSTERSKVNPEAMRRRLARARFGSQTHHRSEALACHHQPQSLRATEHHSHRLHTC